MWTGIQHISALCTVFAITWQTGCAQIKLYQSDGHVSGVTDVKSVRSLLECSVLYKKSGNSKSFNFRKGNKRCELSGNYPEYYTTVAEGWQVYSRIVDGAWASWTSWGSCSLTCGGGTRVRTRSCTNPAPSNGGEQCPGHSVETVSCNAQLCPVDGAWASWTSWGSCSLTCGGGTRVRTQSCINPAPSNGGEQCPGHSVETISCNGQLCPVNGAWTVWTNWGSCTVTCGSGTRTRSRSCTNPSPSNGGTMCPGLFTENVLCNEQTCITGTYSSNYFISTSQLTWDAAKVACEGMSGTLVIIDNQAEQYVLENILTTMQHWIGLRCQSGVNCAWVDGRNIEGGFVNWAPGEPKDRDCVWIGWYTSKWDDDYCDILHEFVCEL